ncbi:MAG: hypothetical protein PHE93_03605, partial [Clostridia bacterium]|nr:hypothetical protein [Clostridia bacterium]
QVLTSSPHQQSSPAVLTSSPHQQVLISKSSPAVLTSSLQLSSVTQFHGLLLYIHFCYSRLFNFSSNP